MVAKAENSPLTFTGDAREIVLLVKGQAPIVTHWDTFRAYCALGAGVVFDPDTVAMVERLLATDVVPGLFWIDGFVCVDAVSVRPMSTGGNA